MKQKSIFRSATGKNKILDFYQEVIESWDLTFQSKMIKTNYGKTHIIITGDVKLPKLVLLHGSSSNLLMWSNEIKELSKQYMIYAIDIIGECGLSEESRPPFKNGNYARWLNQVFEAFHISKASIVGCSLGGWIAIDFSLHYQHKLDKLFLLSTAGLTNIRLSFVFFIMITSVLGEWGFNRINKMVYRDVIIDKTSQLFVSLIKEYFIPRTDVLPVFNNAQLAKIGIPVFYLGGDKDCFYDSVKAGEKVKQFITNAEIKIRKETGHVIPKVSDEIKEFLQASG